MMAGWLIMVLLYLLVTAYVGRRRMERCQGADMTEERRIAQYRFSLLWNAGTLLGMFVLMGLASVGWEEIGLRPVQLRPGGGIVLGAVLFLCVVLTALFLYQMLAFQCSARYRESMTALMTQKRNAGGLYERTVDSLIPGAGGKSAGFSSHRSQRACVKRSFSEGSFCICWAELFRRRRGFCWLPPPVSCLAWPIFTRGSRACSRLRCWGPCLVCCIWGQTRSCCVCRFIFCSIFLRLSSMKVETNKQGRRAALRGGRSLQDVQVVRGPAGRQRRLMCLLPQLRCSRMAFWTHQIPYRARATALRASTTFK